MHASSQKIICWINSNGKGHQALQICTSQALCFLTEMQIIGFTRNTYLCVRTTQGLNNFNHVPRIIGSLYIFCAIRNILFIYLLTFSSHQSETQKMLFLQRWWLTKSQLPCTASLSSIALTYITVASLSETQNNKKSSFARSQMSTLVENKHEHLFCLAFFSLFFFF